MVRLFDQTPPASWPWKVAAIIIAAGLAIKAWPVWEPIVNLFRRRKS